MKAVGYIRVSTQEQATDGVSLDTQRAKIEAWATLHDASVIEVYVDEGISGHKGRAERPGLDAALTTACEHGAALVVYSLSRLARNTKETIEIGECLAECGADLVSLSENIDTTTAAGKMVFRMLAVLAEFERDQVSERTKAAMAHKKAQGQRVGSVPWGLEVGGDGKTLVASEEDEKLRRRVKAMSRRGMSVRAIAAKLAGEGVTSKRGAPINYVTVHRLLNSQRG